MKRFLLYLLPLVGLLLASCSENIHDEDTEFANWQARNTTFFRQKMDAAKAVIASAQAQYGDAWEEHCPYRIYRSYAVGEDTDAAKVDSICVEVLERGTGSGSPLFTDTVKVNYLKRLIPSDSYKEGRVVDHSGYTILPEDIFNPVTGATRTQAVSNLSSSFTIGESTALQHMRIGDRWRIFVPYRIGNGTTETSTIPAYSTLVVDVRLLQYYRAGTTE